MLKGLSVVYLILKFFDLVGDLCFSQLDLFFPPLSGVELFIVFFEIEAAIIKTFCKVFIGYVFTCFVELLFALIKFLYFLIEPGEDDLFGDERLGYHNIENILIGIDFGEYFLYEWRIEIFIFLYSGYGALDSAYSLIDLILFLFIFEELFLELIFPGDDKIAFRP